MTTTSSPTAALVQRDAIAELCARATTPDVLAGIAERVRRVVPYEGSFWSGADPVTILATSPAVVESIPASYCTPFWDLEYRSEDVLHFRSLVRAGRTVATLRDATEGKLRRSPRYLEFLRPNGFSDEARVVLGANDHCWGMVALYRGDGDPPFSADEQRFLADVAPLAADALRRLSMLESTTRPVHADAPGLLVFDGCGILLTRNAEADHWIAELEEPVDGSGPTAVMSVLARVRATASSSASGSARARILGHSGRWIVVHATALAADAELPHVAVVIEAAPRAEVVPIIVEAFGLTAREREVAACVARGLDTGEIAAKLFLSPHTVRDHLKSIFEKVQVSSRGELVARIFHDRMEPADHVA